MLDTHRSETASLSHTIKISLLRINDPKQKSVLEEIMRKQLPPQLMLSGNPLRDMLRVCL